MLQVCTGACGGWGLWGGEVGNCEGSVSGSVGGCLGAGTWN